MAGPPALVWNTPRRPRMTELTQDDPVTRWPARSTSYAMGLLPPEPEPCNGRVCRNDEIGEHESATVRDPTWNQTPGHRQRVPHYCSATTCEVPRPSRCLADIDSWSDVNQCAVGHLDLSTAASLAW